MSKTNRRGVIVLNKDDRYIQLNEHMTLMGGMIDNNPFYKSLRLTKTAEWIVRNREQVLYKIKKELALKKVSRLGYGKGINEAYDYILNYYVTNQDKDFQANYMGTDSHYRIEQYVLSSVRNLLRSMNSKDDMSAKKFGGVVSILGDQDTDNGTYGGTVRESVALTSEDTNDSLNIDYYMECFEYLYILTKEATQALRINMTPTLVFDVYFGDITGYTTEEIQDKHRLTTKRYQTILDKIQTDADTREGMMDMVSELAQPVMNGVVTELDVIQYNFND